MIDGYRNNTVILSCRMVDSSCITFIFYAKLTFWIGRGFRFSRCCNRFWIFLWFGKIDCNVKSAVFCVNRPFAILSNTVSADIITVLA